MRRMPPSSKSRHAAKRPAGRGFAARHEAGRALRSRTPRSSHSKLNVVQKGRDVIALLERSNRGRIATLVPIRYGRMLHSPFAFLRGAATTMAFDLASTPVSGLHVQACGDAHLMNFGGFATPERHLVFDVNDFDETLRAPWEWDLKRLATSVTVAARHLGQSKRHVNAATMAAVAGYREKMAWYASMGALELWYQRIDASQVSELHLDSLDRQALAAPLNPVTEHRYPRLTKAVGATHRIKEERPLIYRPRRGDRTIANIPQLLARYRATLPADRHTLLERFDLIDVAIKVVGVGSVGTRCAIALLMTADHEPLFLQFKEARVSVLEAYVGRGQYANQGERIVVGQRLMQAASDIFLGWTTDPALKVDFYVRQLRDCKTAADVENMDHPHLLDYAGHCGAALARAHAKAGDAAAISGYIGKSAALDEAIAQFAAAYADQNQKDYETLRTAVKHGRIAAMDA